MAVPTIASKETVSALSTPLHKRILTDIEARILSGDWPPGYRLPTELELCREYDCSRMTVSKVLTQLTKAGLIERRKRAGSFVLRPHSQSAILEIHDIRTEVEALGREYGYQLIEHHRREAAAKDRDWLGESAGSRILDLVAIHLASGRPFCIEERSLNLEAVPTAGSVDFASVSPSAWLLQQVPWTTAEHEILAEGANVEISEMLAIPTGTACLVVKRKTWNAIGPVTSVRLTYSGDTHSLVARFTPNQ